MKIGLHLNQADGRGTGKAVLDYAFALKKYYNYEPVIIFSKTGDNQRIEQIQKNFKIIQYDGNVNNENERDLVRYNLLKVVDEEKLDYFHMTKWGVDDKITPNNCKTGIHCVFEMIQPHGNVYAGVSEYLAKKYNQPLFVPPIVIVNNPTENLRKTLNISDDKTVIGRHGGKNTFSIPFVKDAVRDILSYRKDIIFLFLSTEKFLEHERVIFLPWVKTEQETYNFIHACDAMLHARLDGETFGSAVGEFSCANKPVITWSGQNYPGYDKSHLDLLGNKAIIYNEYQDLLDILFSIKRKDTIKRNWDVYSKKFSEKNVIQQFNKIFLS